MTNHQSCKTLKVLDHIFHYVIDDLRISGKSKIHLSMKINFISSDFCDEKRQMYFKRNKAGSMIGFDIDKVVAKVFC